jgi:hypothetical protein
MCCPPAEVDAEVEHVADFLVDHRLGQPNFGIWLRIIPPARESPSKHGDVIALRGEIARDGQ